ncbi:hypothetical protein AK812_SmicGene5467 [Symbiodinium microadriaticum]|uniref:Uncharacterized protein n=1 Tax=Symbiodinium microadriaticum TaxID=2951 RepID=A0A1Q9ETK4_SYMMI|nr:hypothetical protein AK812_SmicGene5467 [Symbiodinium microadriaticum]
MPRSRRSQTPEQKLPKFDSLGRQSRESLQAERSRQHGGESQHVSAPPSFRASKPSSRPSSSGPVRPPSGGGSSPRRASGAGLPASESVGGQQTESASAADEEELAAPPATLTPVALAAAATAAQLERRLREARVSNVSSVPGGPNRRRPHTAGRDRFTRPAHYGGNEGSERQSRDENLSLRRGRNKFLYFLGKGGPGPCWTLHVPTGRDETPLTGHGRAQQRRTRCPELIFLVAVSTGWLDPGQKPSYDPTSAAEKAALEAAFDQVMKAQGQPLSTPQPPVADEQRQSVRVFSFTGAAATDPNAGQLQAASKIPPPQEIDEVEAASPAFGRPMVPANQAMVQQAPQPGLSTAQPMAQSTTQSMAQPKAMAQPGTMSMQTQWQPSQSTSMAVRPMSASRGGTVEDRLQHMEEMMFRYQWWRRIDYWLPDFHRPDQTGPVRHDGPHTFYGQAVRTGVAPRPTLAGNPAVGVPRTLGDDMATFMIWITFPSTLLVPKLLQVLRGGLFELRGDECIWLSNQVLNFSFSPRSALLLFTFGLSIRLQQGLLNPEYGRMLTTIGLRLSWNRWNTLLNSSRVWNRRYLDYFIGMMPTTTFVLHPSTDAATLSGMVVLSHPIESDYLVHALNSTFNNSRVFYRLFHLPVPARAYEALTNSYWWDEVPRELLQHYAFHEIQMRRQQEAEAECSMFHEIQMRRQQEAEAECSMILKGNPKKELQWRL